MQIWKYRTAGALAGLFVGVPLVLALTACDGGPIGDAAKALRDKTDFDHARQRLVDKNAQTYHRADQLYVTHDADNGVTCWSRYSYAETLSCLPDWMLTPAARKPVAIEPTYPTGRACDGNEVCIGMDSRRRALAGNGVAQ